MHALAVLRGYHELRSYVSQLRGPDIARDLFRFKRAIDSLQRLPAATPASGGFTTNLHKAEARTKAGLNRSGAERRCRCSSLFRFVTQRQRTFESRQARKADTRKKILDAS